MISVPLILAASLLTGGTLAGYLLGRRHRLSAAQHRLVAHLRSGQPRLVFVGCPPQAPDRWVPAALCHRRSLTLADGQVLALQGLTAFLVADPHGLLLDSEAPFSPLPPGLHAPPPSRIELPTRAD